MKPNPKNQLVRLILTSIAAPVALVYTASQTYAATTYAGPGDDWADETKWTPNVAPDGPAGAFNQRLNFTGNTTVTFAAAQGTVDLASSVTADARAFVIGNTNGNPDATSVLNITGGTLRINSTANNASTSVSSLVGANGLNSNGTLNVSGTGTLDLTPATGSNHRILSLGLGGTANTGISGTVNLSGDGLIKISQLRFAETAPNAGGSITGVVNLNGGTLETGAIQEVTGTANALVSSTVNFNGGLLRLTAVTGISASLDTVNVLSAGANIEVITGISSVVAKALLDGGSGGGLTKTGDGSLALSGNNTYTGATKINAGTLRFTTQESLYNNVSANWTATNINVLSGATMIVNVDSAGTAGFTNANLDTLLANISVANTAVQGLQAGASFGIDTSTATGASFTQGNIIANSTGANGGAIGLTKLGTGMLVLDENNTYTGATFINAGSLNIQHANALGSAAGGVTLANAGRLELQGGITTAAEVMTLTPGGGGNAMLLNVSGNNTWSGSITSNTPTSTLVSRIQSDLGKLTMSGAVTISGSTHQLVLQGNGDMEISGQVTGVGRITSSVTGTGVKTLANDTNSYTGATLVNGGTVVFTSIHNVGAVSSSLGAPVLADATIFIGGATTAGTLRYAGTAIGGHTSDRVINLAGSTGGATIEANGTGPLVLTSTNTATGVGIKTLTLSGSNTGNNSIGAIVDNSVTNTTAIVKSGLGTWVLTGTNTYTGTTTVNDGTLLVNSPGSLDAASAVAVNNTSTLGGTGTLGGNVTVAAAANLAPGASAGTFTISGNLDISAMAAGAGKLKFELDALAGTNDLLTVGGTLTIGAGDLGLDNLEVTNVAGLQAGTYTLITSTGLSGTVNGSPALIAPGFNGKLQTNGNNLELVVTAAGGSAYSIWAAVNAPSQDPDEDFDLDGVPNAVEFVLGGLATTKDLDKLPLIGTSGGNMTFTFKRDVDSIDPKTALFIETSTDLATWNTAPSPYTVPDTAITGPPITVVEDTPVGFDTVTLTVPQSPDAKKFARLKVVITP